MKHRLTLVHRSAILIEPVINPELIGPSLRVHWQEIEDARRDYGKWRSFVLWLRAIRGRSRHDPGWLLEIVRKSAPAVAEFEAKHNTLAPDEPVYRRLQRWVDEVVFVEANREGWFSVVRWFYAADPFSQRLEAYARHCREEWAQRPPNRYPAWPEWCEAAHRCRTDLLKGIPYRYMRDLVAAIPVVTRRRLNAAMTRYIEWEVFAYWARTAMNLVGGLPPSVAGELRCRCPDFLERDQDLCRSLKPSYYYKRWDSLIDWIQTHWFQSAKKEGWLNLLAYCARLHPHLQRTMAYWVRWDAAWLPRSSAQYPVFERWCRAADIYVYPAHQGPSGKAKTIDPSSFRFGADA